MSKILKITQLKEVK